MKKLLLAGVAALSMLSTSTVHSAQLTPIPGTVKIVTQNPPEQYDHPYTTGRLFVALFDLKTVRSICPKRNYVATGCGWVWQGLCVIVAASAKDQEAQHQRLDLVLEHELAHCNGWPADHPEPRLCKEGLTSNQITWAKVNNVSLRSCEGRK